MSTETDLREEIQPEPETTDSATTDEEQRIACVAIDLPEPVLQRIRDHAELDVIEESDALNGAGIVLLSTRTPRVKLLQSVEEVARQADAPIVVVCHAGGEGVAVEAMLAGASGVVAEGNEAACRAVAEGGTGGDGALQSFHGEQIGARHTPQTHNDRVTHLPGASAFETRLAELVDRGRTPQLLLLELGGLEAVRRATDSVTVDAIRRRIAGFYSAAAAMRDCETFVIDDARFAMVNADASIDDCERFARELIEVTEAFTPVDNPLALSVGYAEPDTGETITALRDKTSRALDMARQKSGSAVVSSADVTHQLSSATELEVALQLGARADELVPYPEGHGGRVAKLAADIGRANGLQGRELTSVRLAALLHDIGVVGSTPSASHPHESDEGRAQRPGQVRRASLYASLSAGAEVAEIIELQLECWDGSGPLGMVTDAIPLGARIVALADVLDTWLVPIEGQSPVPTAEIVARLGEEAGVRFDPALVTTAMRLIERN